jgi:quercetin dioxygenase-like cupin family protein
VSSWALVRAGEATFRPAGEALAEGLTEAILVGEAQGAIHLEVALTELAPGGRVAGHLHPFEESFYILSGQVLVDLAGTRYRLVEDDFGFVPVAVPHAWSNPGTAAVRWLRTRSPQPRAIGERTGTYPSQEAGVPTDGRPITEAGPTQRWVGHFSEDHLPPPGPLAMRGYRGPHIHNISLWMLVDDLLGAIHHTMFVVEFQPNPEAPRVGGDHFHPFEEAYYFVRGSATGYFEGETREVDTGDLVFAGTNAFHGYANRGTRPVRWIEVQAPTPPPSGAFFFRKDWERVER